MPTIDELQPAVASADDDLLPVSQGGAARRVTRAQLLAGVQQELAVMPGLLGRASSGAGAPERIAIGANLRLTNGVLSGSPPFRIGDLPAGSPPGVSDLLAISQAGNNTSVPLGSVLAAISSVPGIDVSGAVARAAVGVQRSLADWLVDAVAVEAFGAVGDGVTDDQAAFDRAVSSGRPVRLGPRTYVVNGQWTLGMRAVLIGTPGLTVVQRKSQAGGAWISIGGPSFTAIGITFDAGQLSGDSWGLLVVPTCTETLFERCAVRNATGSTLGTGLTVQARDGLAGTPSAHRIVDCVFYNNAVHGLWVQAAAGVVVQSCTADGNGGYGICLDDNDPTFQQVVRAGAVLNCRASGNQRGISIGNYNETNAEPPRWGTAHPDAVGILISGNVCFDNTAYGIAGSGKNIQISGNQVSSRTITAAGILLNAVRSSVTSNLIFGPGQFGIDAGGCIDCEVSGNFVQDFAVGINPGGGHSIRVEGNRLCGNVWGITAYQVETDGQGRNFGIPSQGLRLERNLIQLKDGSGGGIFLVDGPQDVVVVGNDFEGGPGSSTSQALWAHTDSVLIGGNRWNSQSKMICNPVESNGSGQVQFPDMLDAVMVTAAAQPIASLVGQHQAGMAGQVSFIRVTNGGAGYSRASITVTGTGSGAQATAYIRDGVVIGVALSSGGAGYGASGTTVQIVGDGAGAAAVACVGLLVPQGRRLTVHCNGPVRFKRAGSVPFQDNWTGTDMLVPSASEIVWSGTWGGWHAVSFTCGDYVSPAGDGSVTLRSSNGDVTLRPAARGQVRVGSDTEAVGFVTTLGRGSPEGVVAAPPGSDFRNLDGGAGTTLWLKRAGTGTSGWAAVA